MTDGVDGLLDLRRRLYRMLDAGSLAAAPGAPGFTPPLDIVRHPEGLTITVELPGMAREDVQVELTGNVLTITGDRATGLDDKRSCFCRRERPCGPFTRSLALPTSDHKELSAALRDGVLTVKVRIGEAEA